jgi:hypothetical protein
MITCCNLLCQTFKTLKHAVVDYDLLVLWTILGLNELFELTLEVRAVHVLPPSPPIRINLDAAQHSSSVYVQPLVSWVPFYTPTKAVLLLGISFGRSEVRHA